MDNIEMILTGLIEPHPDNPRKDLGDLKELTESIRQNGIYQNLTVVPRRVPMVGDDKMLIPGQIQRCSNPAEKERMQEAFNAGLKVIGYTVIIGHRRLAAAKEANLKKVPCAVVEMAPQKQIETMILENMQRADLTVYEQVKGFQLLLDLGDSIEGIAQKTGFSEKTIKRRTEIARLDPDKLERVMKGRGKQLTLEEFDKLAGIKDLETRNKLLEEIGTRNFDYVVAAAKAAEKTKEMIPAVQEWIKNFPGKKEKVSESEAWGYDLLTLYPGVEIKKWKTEKDKADAALKKLRDGETLFYTITTGGYLKLLKKREIVKPKKKSAAEIKKEKEMNEAWDYLIAQSRLSYELRKKFIKEIEITKSNYDKVIEGFMLLLIAREGGYGELDFNRMLALVGVDNEKSRGATYDKKAVDIIKNLDVTKHRIIKELPQFIWSCFDDGPGLIHDGANVWRGQWPEYDEQRPDIWALYKWLEGLGYQISEVERGLIEGTDVNYHLGDAKKEAAE
ncbi:MAG: ParB N-terminal domain-containing protein [Acidaminococcaceae bacterium]|nr:ParB N-terminal domain-containing protein [Acidaminococcaceae bacterium]